MSNQKLNRRHVTGVTLDSPVHAYLDDLATRMRCSRSWVLNTIVYEYAKLMEKRNLMPLAGILPAPESKEAVIKLSSIAPFMHQNMRANDARNGHAAPFSGFASPTTNTTYT